MGPNDLLKGIFPRSYACMENVANVIRMPFMIAGYLFGVIWAGLAVGFHIGTNQ